MADLKISQLTSAALPLAGTEVLPIVQSGATTKVATDDLTVKNVRSNATTGILQVVGPAAGTTRTMTTPNANFTVARTDAAQSFTGDQTLSTGNLVIGTNGKGIDFSVTPGTGTSELFADYEEGTWTPRNGYVTLTNNVTARYTKIGRFVYATFDVSFPVNSQGNLAEILDLPFSSNGTTNTGCATYTDYGSILMLQLNFSIGGNIYNSAGSALTNANLSGKRIVGMYVYSV